MKKLSIAVLALMALTSCQKQKMAFVDTGKVVNEIKLKKNVEEKFKQKEAALTQKTDSLKLAFQTEVQEASALASKMKDQSKIQQLSQSFQQKDQMLSRQIQSEQQGLANDYRTEIDSVINNVKSFVKDYGKTNGYDYILGTSDNTASVMYAKDTSDLTEEIIEAFNAENNK
ncbi:OmpH family outer membrane protein [Aurantibacter sp.]|uniref:OmpH family outer membrane protein n=1 Tax=Aurantibacter sp. TaxID=2807103 RepID=UPI0035C7D150